MSRAVIRIVAASTVDQGNIEPKLVVDDAVFELRLCAASELVGLADFVRGTAAGATADEGLGVLRASGDFDRSRLLVLVDAPDPNVVAAAVGNNGVAGYCEAGLQSGEKECGFGEHLDEDEVMTEKSEGVASWDEGMWWKGRNV